MYDSRSQSNHYQADIRRPPRRRAAVRLRDERGQAIVEFALVVPILLAVVVAIVSFGRAMNYDEQATHLANEAVRFAAVDQVPAGATGTLGQWLRSQGDTPELRNGSADVTQPTVCVSYPNGTATPGDPVTVSMSFRFHWLPILNAGPYTTITRTATMRIEVAPTGSFYTAGCT